MSRANVKGAVFESVVRRFALAAGYRSIARERIEAQLFVRGGMPMVHGLGEAHNADVLLEPPVTLPLSPSTILIIECKGYRERVGLDVIRGAIGLRTDLNAYRRLSEESIQRRISGGRRQLPEHFPYFHVAVASLFGFSGPAQHYAAAHHVELLDYSKLPLLGKLSELIEQLPEIETEGPWRRALEGLLGARDEPDFEYNQNDLGELRAALAPIAEILNKVGASYVATLASGVTVNMLGASPLRLLAPLRNSDFRFKARFSERRSNNWRLEADEGTLEFTLPDQLLFAWEQRGRHLRHAAAIKAEHFSRIELIGPVRRPDGSTAIRHVIGELDPSFLEEISAGRR